MVGRLKALQTLISKGLSDKLTHESARLLALNVLGVALLMGMHVLIARVLGVHEYSNYTLALALAAIAGLFYPLGINHLLWRGISTEQGSGRYDRIKSMVLSSWLIAISIAATVFLIALVFQDAVRAYFPEQPVIATIVVMAALLALAQSGLSVVHAALVGARRQFAAQLLMECVRPVVLAFMVVLLFMVSAPLEFRQVVLANVGVVAVVMAVGFISLWVALPLWTAKGKWFDPAATKRWLVVSVPLLLYFVPHNLLIHIDILFISVMLDVSQNGLYFAAARVSVFVAFPLYAVNAIISPALSAAYTQGKSLNQILRATPIFVVPLSLAVFGLLAVIGQEILGFFGPEFVDAYPTMMVIAGGYLVLSILGPVDFALTMTKFEKISALVMTGGVAMDVVLNLLLIPRFGMTGAAFATAASLVIIRLAFTVMAWRLLGVSVYPLPKFLKKISSAMGEPRGD